MDVIAYPYHNPDTFSLISACEKEAMDVKSFIQQSTF